MDSTSKSSEAAWIFVVSISISGEMRVANIATVFTSFCSAISGRTVCRTFGRNPGIAKELMSPRHIRFLKTAALFLIASSALNCSCSLLCSS
jgi:hypothetical protein